MPNHYIKQDIIHFEALGDEAKHLEEETLYAIESGFLPNNHSFIITADNLQTYLLKNPKTVLPDIISTKTHSKIPDSYLAGTKKNIITRSAGFDHFEQIIEKAHITSLREYCVNAVAQTAIKFLYATAGELNHYGMNCRSFERENSRAFMELEPSRIATVFGVGKIGKRIHDLLKANGLTVYGVDIREVELNREYDGEVNFVSKTEGIKNSDIVINAMNLTRNRDSIYYNEGYFSSELFEMAEKKLIFINITRGEIAPEEILLKLYDDGKITGLGLDVFSDESGFADNLKGDTKDDIRFAASKELLNRHLHRTANIYLQPHQGFNSDIAVKAKAKEAIKHVISWYQNHGKGFDEELPYYL